MSTTKSTSKNIRQVIRIANFGEDATGRRLGEQIRAMVDPSVDVVVFDCQGVESMSASFADELFGKLATETARPRISVVNASDNASAAIRFAVNQRTR